MPDLFGVNLISNWEKTFSPVKKKERVFSFFFFEKRMHDQIKNIN